jgi:exopolysaccharide biosynthesis polyprenyl glycosylphosphotransferase
VSVTLEQIHDVVDARTLEILRLRRSAKGIHRRGWLVRRALLVADLAALTLAFLLAQQLYGVGSGGAGHLSEWAEHVLFVLSLPVWVVAAKLYGLYDRDEERTDHSTTDDFTGVFHLVTVITWLIVIAAYLTPIANPEFQKLLVFWSTAVVAIPLARVAARAYCRRQVDYLQNTVIVGAGEVGQSLARRLLKHPEYGLNLVGFVDATPRERQAGLAHLALLGAPADLPELVRMLDIERAVFAFTSDGHAEMLELARELNDLDVQVDIVPRYFEVVGQGVSIHAVEGLPVIGLPPLRLSRSSKLLKRTMDVVVTGIALCLLAPVFGLVALLIKLDSSGAVFFRQVRVGLRDEVFSIWKFRTMTTDAEEKKDLVRHLNVHLSPGGDARMFKVQDDPRVTRIGRVLRRYSIDELPQLFNVLAGQMSLVGPRPLILEEDRHVEDWARRRLDLKPGMTGLWQVLGRSQIPFSEMVRLDYLYVTSWSLAGDLKLILRTLPGIVRAAGSG